MMNSSFADSNRACPLCATAETKHFYTDQGSARFPRIWPYFHCDECDLIFRDAETYLSREDEQAHYQLHNNDVSDPGYLRFLQTVYDWACQFFPAGARGLDFGCGPGPALALRLEEAGYRMSKWDPYFFPDGSILSERFDFITCTEVFEHFYEPGWEIDRLLDRLKPDGHLIVRTGLHNGKAHFPSWNYRVDATHVCFFSVITFEWLAREYDLGLEIPAPHHAILKKSRL